MDASETLPSENVCTVFQLLNFRHQTVSLCPPASRTSLAWNNSPTPPPASRYLSAGAFLRLGVYKSWSGRAVSRDDTHHKHCWPLAIAAHFFICSSPPHTSAEGAGRIPHQRGITLLADRKQLYNLLYKALSGIDVSLAIKKKKKKIRPDCLWQLMWKRKKEFFWLQ